MNELDTNKADIQTIDQDKLLAWLRHLFVTEWTYAPGTSEVVEEIINEIERGTFNR